MTEKELVLKLTDSEVIIEIPRLPKYKSLLFAINQFISLVPREMADVRSELAFKPEQDSEILSFEPPEKKEKYVDAKEIQKFIESQPDCKHSCAMISQQFYGRIVRSNIDDLDRLIYNNIWSKARRIRKKLEKKYNGKFISERDSSKFGATATYRFIPNNFSV